MAKGKEASASREVPLPPLRVYESASRLEDFPLWFDHLVAVRRTGPRTSVWTLKGEPPLAWRVETTQDRKGQVFAWSSVGDRILTYGSIELEGLAPARTRVTFRRYHATGKGIEDRHLREGPLQDPQAKLEADLDRFVRHLVAPPAAVRPLERGGFTLGPPHGAGSAAAPAPRSAPPPTPQARVSFQRLGTRPGPPRA